MIQFFGVGVVEEPAKVVTEINLTVEENEALAITVVPEIELTLEVEVCENE